MNKKELLPKAKQIFESLPHCENLLATSDGQFFEPTPANTGNVYSHANVNRLQVFTISKQEAETGITNEELTDQPVVEEPVVETPVVVEPIVPEQTEKAKIEGDTTPAEATPEQPKKEKKASK